MVASFFLFQGVWLVGRWSLSLFFFHFSFSCAGRLITMTAASFSTTRATSWFMAAAKTLVLVFCFFVHDHILTFFLDRIEVSRQFQELRPQCDCVSRHRLAKFRQPALPNRWGSPSFPFSFSLRLVAGASVAMFQAHGSLSWPDDNGEFSNQYHFGNACINQVRLDGSKGVTQASVVLVIIVIMELSSRNQGIIVIMESLIHHSFIHHSFIHHSFISYVHFFLSFQGWRSLLLFAVHSWRLEAAEQGVCDLQQHLFCSQRHVCAGMQQNAVIARVAATWPGCGQVRREEKKNKKNVKRKKKRGGGGAGG